MVTRLTPPRKRYRILRDGDPAVIYYTTQEARDQAAQRHADRDNATVMTELWDKSHPQDPLNRGWACDGTRTPTAPTPAPEPAPEPWEVKETVTAIRRLVLDVVAHRGVRWGGVEPGADGPTLLYGANALNLSITPANLTRAVLWLLRRGYVRTAGTDPMPPVGSLITPTSKGHTALLTPELPDPLDLIPAYLRRR